MNTQSTVINTAKTSTRALNAGLWVVQLGAAFIFIMAGWSKVSGDPQMVGLFGTIGFGHWFRYLTGALEIFGAMLLVVPVLAGLGGILLTGVMAGALATHLFLIGGNPTMAVVLFIACGLIAVGRKDRTLKLLGRD